MILILGASGYIGQAFVAELTQRGEQFTTVSRSKLNYGRFESLLNLLDKVKPDFLVNCAGYTGKPNVDVCEVNKVETLLGNVLLPQTVAQACAAAAVPWGHVSSGCIYAGAKVRGDDGVYRIETDLTKGAILQSVLADRAVACGFTELDQPNFNFRSPPCSFYSGTKALGEEIVTDCGRSYIWRLRIPFDQFDSPRNYLSKVQRYSKVYENINSISHRGDFAKACLDCWFKKVPWGVYNVTNPGWVTTSEVVTLVKKYVAPHREFEFWENDAQFYGSAAVAPRSNCILDSSKLTKAGIEIRPVGEAILDSLKNWKPE